MPYINNTSFPLICSSSNTSYFIIYWMTLVNDCIKNILIFKKMKTAFSYECYILPYVTRSRGMSHMSAMFNIAFLTLITCTFKVLHFDLNPISVGHPVAEIWTFFLKFKNNEKYKNLSPLYACNSKSIFLTSDSFPLIMSHILYFIGI